MDAAVGSDYLYMSGECSQDVYSVWSDAWSVGDPVSMPEMNFDDEFNDVFPTGLVQSSDDMSLWDVLESASPNAMAGYVQPSGGSDLSVTACIDSVDCSDVLSPTDSGHYSTVSQCTLDVAGDVHTDRDEHISELNSPLDNNDHSVTDFEAEFRKVPLNILPHDTDDKNVIAERRSVREAVCLRPQRVAARRAETALAKEGSSDDDDAGDDDDDEFEDSRLRSRRQLQTTEITSSRRGRSRLAEVNRNALNARINRQKKKAYIASLESQKSRLLSENKRMKSALTSLVYERNDLIDEVKYLKSVLANDSVLARLVQNINGPPLKMSSQFDSAAQKRKDVESDHNYSPAGKRRATLSSVKAGGICLHVSEHQMSLELCHRCAHMADGRHIDSDS